MAARSFAFLPRRRSVRIKNDPSGLNTKNASAMTVVEKYHGRFVGVRPDPVDPVVAAPDPVLAPSGALAGPFARGSRTESPDSLTVRLHQGPRPAVHHSYYHTHRPPGRYSSIGDRSRANGDHGFSLPYLDETAMSNSPAGGPEYSPLRGVEFRPGALDRRSPPIEYNERGG